MGCYGAGEVSGKACTRNEYGSAARLGVGQILLRGSRRAVRRGNFHLIANAEACQHIAGALHDWQI